MGQVGRTTAAARSPRGTSSWPARVPSRASVRCRRLLFPPASCPPVWPAGPPSCGCARRASAAAAAVHARCDRSGVRRRVSRRTEALQSVGRGTVLRLLCAPSSLRMLQDVWMRTDRRAPTPTPPRTLTNNHLALHHTPMRAHHTTSRGRLRTHGGERQRQGTTGGLVCELEVPRRARMLNPCTPCSSPLHLKPVHLH